MAAPPTTKPQSSLARRVARRLARPLRSSPPPKATTAIKKAAPAKKRAATTPSGPHCVACLSPHISPELLTHGPTGRTITAQVCQRCRFVGLPENSYDYMGADTTRNLAGGVGARCGTTENPGREFGMARLGIATLKRKDLSVLVYGAGESVDNHHIEKLDRISRVAIGDLIKLRDDAEYVNTSKLATEKFDIVVASEVIEHFPEPRENFANLFSFVADDGIIIASTNIRDHAQLNKLAYIWSRGHVAYYSPRSLRVISRSLDMHVDFRVPLVATGLCGPRKRYVIFSRSTDVMDSVSDWFGSHMYAPSESLDAVTVEPSALAGP
jgi:SAM-dependent methyltransferase